MQLCIVSQPIGVACGYMALDLLEVRVTSSQRGLVILELTAKLKTWGNTRTSHK